MRGFLLVSLLLPLVLAACGGDSAKAYSSYQFCFDDVLKQDKTPVETIVKCCIEHEINGTMPPVCGDAEPDCINFLTTNLKQTDADITVKQEACASYVAEKAK